MKKEDLTPPSCYINTLLDNKEVICLLNTLTKYYSQTGRKYHAELVVSNNEWEPVKNDGVTLGRKRKDITVSLDGLNCVYIESDRILFKYTNETELNVPVTKDFFYYMNWEEDYYE